MSGQKKEKDTLGYFYLIDNIGFSAMRTQRQLTHQHLNEYKYKYNNNNDGNNNNRNKNRRQQSCSC